MKITISRHLNGVDLLKFIMAFAVITIHAQVAFHYEYSELINWFIRLAVPFYFITSGFLTFRRMSSINSRVEKSNYLKKRAGRFGAMFFLWLVIYMPLSLVTFNFGSASILLKDIFDYISRVILAGESIWAWPLWYLYSSMIAYFLLSIIYRYESRKYIIGIIAVVAIGGNLLLPYIVFPKVMVTILTGFFERILYGFPYIVLGFMLYEYNRIFINTLTTVTFLALSYALFIYDFNFFPVFGGIALFVVSFKIILPDKETYKKLNIIGVWIYLTHMFNLLIIDMLLQICNISLDKYVVLFISFAFTFVSSSLLYLLSDTKAFKFLNKLV